MPTIGNEPTMLHLSLEYKFAKEPTRHRLEHPLLDVLESVHQTGSIGRAAKQLGRSYRYVWSELKPSNYLGLLF